MNWNTSDFTLKRDLLQTVYSAGFSFYLRGIPNRGGKIKYTFQKLFNKCCWMFNSGCTWAVYFFNINLYWTTPGLESLTSVWCRRRR